jgi:hypothetical protein
MPCEPPFSPWVGDATLNPLRAERTAAWYGVGVCGIDPECACTASPVQKMALFEVPAMTTLASGREERIDSTKGIRIFVRSWHPESKPRAVIVISHGVNSHSGDSATSRRGCRC